jgi:nitrogen-specific signal transduction histidine kinase
MSQREEPQGMSSSGEGQAVASALLSTLRDAVFVVDMTGGVTLVGGGAEELLGPREPGGSLWELVPAVDRVLVTQALAAQTEAGPPRVAVNLLGEGGRWVPVELAATPLDGGGGSTGFVIVASPEHMLNSPASGDEATDALIDMVRSMYNLNHDIRSPLGAILGNAQLAQRAATDGDPRVVEKLDRIVRLCDRVNQLLDAMTRAKQELVDRAPHLAPLVEPPEASF